MLGKSIEFKNNVEDPAELFPLFTKRGLCKRWGTTYKVINNWETRHTDFPASVVGIIIAGDDVEEPRSRVYPAKEVLRYERERKIKVADDSNRLLAEAGWANVDK
jgi:hypothetical protein